MVNHNIRAFIDGLIRASGSANLFLLNPAGIIFGEGARLDIGGSFYGSTADSILFEDGEFSATDLENPPLLTINAPIGLNFRDNPGEITVRGDGNGTRTNNELIDTENALRVNSSSTLGLIGGNLNLEGATLKTDGGRIELGTVASNERVSFTPIAEGFSLGYEGVENFGDLNLSQTATVDASGLVSGDIQVQGNNITLTNGSRIEASALGNIPTQETPGNIEINASDTITIDGESSQGFVSSARSLVRSDAVGNAGDLTITTGNLNLTNGGLVDASTFGQGNAGSVTITARDTIIIDGEDSLGFPSGALSEVDEEAVGNAGGIAINTGNLNLTNGGVVAASTFGQGNAGSVTITARDTIIIDGEDSLGFVSGAFSEVDEEAVGNAGGIAINTGNLNLTNGGVVDASTSGQGNAGDVTVNATESIVISGLSVEANVRSGLYAQALGNSNGGSVNVFTNQLTIDDGGTIDVGNFDDFILISGTGEPGNINIEANSLNLSNEGRIVAASQAETGDTGNINLLIANEIILRDNSFISAQAFNKCQWR